MISKPSALCNKGQRSNFVWHPKARFHAMSPKHFHFATPQIQPQSDIILNECDYPTLGAISS